MKSVIAEEVVFNTSPYPPFIQKDNNGVFQVFLKDSFPSKEIKFNYLPVRRLKKVLLTSGGPTLFSKDIFSKEEKDKSVNYITLYILTPYLTSLTPVELNKESLKGKKMASLVNTSYEQSIAKKFELPTPLSLNSADAIVESLLKKRVELIICIEEVCESMINNMPHYKNKVRLYKKEIKDALISVDLVFNSKKDKILFQEIKRKLTREFLDSKRDEIRRSITNSVKIKPLY